MSMENKILLISGPAGSGKSTISKKLTESNERFKLLKKHKYPQDGIKKEEYYNISEKEFRTLSKQNAFIQWHERYGNLYGISIKEIHSIISNNAIPIIHPGNILNLYEVLDFLGSRYSLYSVLLFCDSEHNYKNLKQREASESGLKKRVSAYHEELEILKNYVGNRSFNYFIDNSHPLTRKYEQEIISKFTAIISSPPKDFLPKNKVLKYLEAAL